MKISVFVDCRKRIFRAMPLNGQRSTQNARLMHFNGFTRLLYAISIEKCAFFQDIVVYNMNINFLFIARCQLQR